MQGFKKSCAYKKNDRPETYMYHVQKVCGKITLTLNFKSQQMKTWDSDKRSGMEKRLTDITGN